MAWVPAGHLGLFQANTATRHRVLGARVDSTGWTRCYLPGTQESVGHGAGRLAVYRVTVNGALQKRLGADGGVCTIIPSSPTPAPGSPWRCSQSGPVDLTCLQNSSLFLLVLERRVGFPVSALKRSDAVSPRQVFGETSPGRQRACSPRREASGGMARHILPTRLAFHTALFPWQLPEPRLAIHPWTKVAVAIGPNWNCLLSLAPGKENLLLRNIAG